MSRKNIIIVAIIMVIIFLITIVGIIVSRSNNTKDKLDNKESTYATNEVASTSTAVMTEVDDTIVMSNITYNNVNYLTKAQYTDRSNLIQLVSNYADVDAKKVVSKVDLSESSTDEQTYATIFYADNTSESLVILYDNYTTHSFMSCMSLEEWQSIQNGDNAG